MNNHRLEDSSKKTKNRAALKLGLNALMAFLLSFLMKVAFTGLLWHEILGLFLTFLFTTHIFLNWKVTLGLLKKIFSSVLKPRSRVLILIDLLLAFLAMALGLTGVLISGELFSIPLEEEIRLKLANLHSLLGYGLYLGTGIHIGFHWKAIMGGIRRLLGRPPLKKAGQTVLRIFSLIIVLLGIRGVPMTLPELEEPVEEEKPQETSQEEGQGYQEQEVGEVQELDDERSGSPQEEDIPTLEEYLSKLHCDGCSRHCPLSDPRCGVGIEQARDAQEDYKEEYGERAEAKAEAVADGEEENPAQPSAIPTLEEYLSKLHCNLCPNNCPLTSPGCGRGEEVAAQAKAAYYEEYGLEELAGEDPVLQDLVQGYLPMMGAVVAGTHYILLIPEALKKRKE